MAQHTTSSLNNGQSRVLKLMIPVVVMFSAAIILVGLRLYVRARILRKMGMDDLFIVLGMVGTRLN